MFTSLDIMELNEDGLLKSYFYNLILVTGDETCGSILSIFYKINKIQVVGTDLVTKI